MKLFVSVLMFVAVLTANADEYTVYPLQDTYTVDAGGCFGDLTYCEIAWRPTHSHPDTRVMMQFDLEEYTGCTIDSAILKFRIYDVGCIGTTIDIFHITEGWDETWSGSHASHGDDVWYDNYHIGSNGWHELDITDLVQSWLSGILENHGLVMACINDNQADSRMYSRDITSESLRPIIVITVPMALDQSTWGAVKNAF